MTDDEKIHVLTVARRMRAASHVASKGRWRMTPKYGGIVCAEPRAGEEKPDPGYDNGYLVAESIQPRDALFIDLAQPFNVRAVVELLEKLAGDFERIPLLIDALKAVVDAKGDSALMLLRAEYGLERDKWAEKLGAIPFPSFLEWKSDRETRAAAAEMEASGG